MKKISVTRVLWHVTHTITKFFRLVLCYCVDLILLLIFQLFYLFFFLVVFFFCSCLFSRQFCRDRHSNYMVMCTIQTLAARPTDQLTSTSSACTANCQRSPATSNCIQFLHAAPPASTASRPGLSQTACIRTNATSVDRVCVWHTRVI